MDAKEFYKEFLLKTTERLIENESGEKRIKDIYRNSSMFTPEIMSIINEIIKNQEKAETNDDKIENGKSNEYFRIDACGWTSYSEEMSKEVKQFGLNGHAWNLDVAVEHENSVKDWTDEITKLIHIKCPLKVIIGYNYCNRRDKEDNPEEDDRSDETKLKVVAKWMNNIKAFNIGEDEKYLIIIGNAQARGRNKKDYVDLDYRGYLYNRKIKKFEQI